LLAFLLLPVLSGEVYCRDYNSTAADSLASARIDSSESYNKTSEDSVYIMHKSPTVAVLKSAVLPGWGQYYNESYIKIPVVWGIAAYFTYQWIQNNNSYKEYSSLYKKKYNASQSNADNYKTMRDDYRSNRDMFSIYLGLTYLLNLVDAYVDAHLFDFSVDQLPVSHTPQLKMKIQL
jgi:hypothetical protein